MKNFLIALDQLANTLLGGSPDETISARSWRLRNQSRKWAIARRVIDTLFWFEKDHCESSYQSECDRKQLPAEYRVKSNQLSEDLSP